MFRAFVEVGMFNFVLREFCCARSHLSRSRLPERTAGAMGGLFVYFFFFFFFCRQL